jgi:hypothetical protein
VVASESGEVGNPGTLGMTKGRVVLPFRFGAADDEQQGPPLRFSPVGMTLLFGTFSVSAGSRTLSSIDCEYSTHFRVSGVFRLVKSGIS